MKVGIYSLGCKVNIYESEYVVDLLKKAGFEIVDFIDQADIYIINTCSVTNESDRKSRKIINQAKKNNKDAIIVVMGCYSQIKHNDIEADIVLGNKDKSKIVELINECVSKKKKIEKIYDLARTDFESMEINQFDNHTRAFVKIQDGCNAFCSYCIIPYARGRVRSKKEEDVIKEITSLVENGYKEIVLTGIHTGRYGIDIDTNLETLLRKIIKIPNIFRVRLSSIEINEITDGILSLMSETDIIADHLHIPLQSGSDKILKLMNRKYDTAYFINRVNDIKKIRSNISITTDLIVGFPNETEEDFKDTIRTINKVSFTKIHTFPYSKREGTPAAIMKNQVDGNVKKERVHRILELSDKLENNYYNKFINKKFMVITEVRKNNKVFAHTTNFIPVELDNNIENNKLVKVEINSIKDLKGQGIIVD